VSAHARHRPRKRFGQHFLEPAWVRKVVDAVAPRPDDHLLEIGPGHGALTLKLAARVARLTAVEIDRDLAARLARDAPPNVDVITGDFLDVAADLLPSLGRVRVVGNLPYQISSPILLRLLTLVGDFPGLVDATVMLQREVAERLAAGPGSKVYGSLSVIAAAVARVEIVLRLPAGAFRPAPKVESAVAHLEFDHAASRALPSGFHRLVKLLFSQRRKTMTNTLGALLPAGERPKVGRLLAAAAVDPRARVETLPVATLVRLAAAVDDARADGPP
jgi:16S rRNA (adenine1518-N6/adenine1519-N6)-dimethyltransferase